MTFSSSEDSGNYKISRRRQLPSDDEVDYNRGSRHSNQKRSENSRFERSSGRFSQKPPHNNYRNKNEREHSRERFFQNQTARNDRRNDNRRSRPIYEDRFRHEKYEGRDRQRREIRHREDERHSKFKTIRENYQDRENESYSRVHREEDKIKRLLFEENENFTNACMQLFDKHRKKVENILRMNTEMPSRERLQRPVREHQRKSEEDFKSSEKTARRHRFPGRRNFNQFEKWERNFQDDHENENASKEPERAPFFPQRGHSPKRDSSEKFSGWRRRRNSRGERERHPRPKERNTDQFPSKKEEKPSWAQDSEKASQSEQASAEEEFTWANVTSKDKRHGNLETEARKGSNEISINFGDNSGKVKKREGKKDVKEKSIDFGESESVNEKVAKENSPKETNLNQKEKEKTPKETNLNQKKKEKTPKETNLNQKKKEKTPKEKALKETNLNQKKKEKTPKEKELKETTLNQNKKEKTPKEKALKETTLNQKKKEKTPKENSPKETNLNQKEKEPEKENSKRDSKLKKDNFFTAQEVSASSEDIEWDEKGEKEDEKK